ncbi:MAG: ATP-binding protein, partial [Nostocales cyanobacterium 94392]|nr:ATP-binding protein [Nostocales cyanobacterium 94392]
MNLNNLPLLFDNKQTVVSVETPITERFKILGFVHKLALNLQLPLYFWNTGYFQLQLFNDLGQLLPTQNQCTSGLNWILQHPDVPGVFVFEGVISPDISTGRLSQQTEMMLSNLVYDLDANSVPRFLVCMESYVELPYSLAPLIPVLVNPLPTAIAIKTLVRDLCDC